MTVMMYKSDRFMICFGNVRQNLEKLKLWEAFIQQFFANDMWKSTDYDLWKPEDGDWGWVSSSSSNGNITLQY